MRIEVTQEDIDKGMRGNCGWCPIALALARAVPRSRINVGRVGVFLAGRHYDLPETAADFIRSFDSGEDVEPFAFELPIEA